MFNSFLSLANTIDKINSKLASVLMWLSLMLVLVQFSLVISAHVFHIGSIGMQELLFYINSLMFLAGAGYTLLEDEHVRVDIFYIDASENRKHLVNLLGSVFLLLPVVILVWLSATPYVVSSWRVLEGSIETSGLHSVFILKTFILLFAATLSLQGFSLGVKSLYGLMKTGGGDD